MIKAGYKEQAMSHPEQLQLVAYYENPERDEFESVRRHLAGCAECRKRVILIERLIQTLSSQDGADIDRQSLDEERSQLLAEYVDGLLVGDDLKRAEKLLADLPQALKSVLHYQLASDLMQGLDQQQSVNNRQPDSGQRQHVFKRWAELKHWFHNRPETAWTLVSTAAILVLALSVTIWSNLQSTTQFQIAAYQDDPVLYQQSGDDSMPGIGFFNLSMATRAPYGKVKIEQQQSGIHFTWPEVQDAAQYQFVLSRIENTERVNLYSVETNTATAFVDQLTLVDGTRYEWELSGVTVGGTRFNTRGGFVIVKQ